MLSYMLLSAPKPLKPKGMSNTPLLRPFPPLYAPFYCFGGLDWTNILKLKVIAFQNAIIHASICSRTLWDFNQLALHSKSSHCVYGDFGPFKPISFLGWGGGYFQDRKIPKVSRDFLWPKEQHLGVPKFLFWVLQIKISPIIRTIYIGESFRSAFERIHNHMWLFIPIKPIYV